MSTDDAVVYRAGRLDWHLASDSVARAEGFRARVPMRIEQRRAELASMGIDLSPLDGLRVVTAGGFGIVFDLGDGRALKLQRDPNDAWNTERVRLARAAGRKVAGVPRIDAVWELIAPPARPRLIAPRRRVRRPPVPSESEFGLYIIVTELARPSEQGYRIESMRRGADKLVHEPVAILRGLAEIGVYTAEFHAFNWGHTDEGLVLLDLGGRAPREWLPREHRRRHVPVERIASLSAALEQLTRRRRS